MAPEHDPDLLAPDDAHILGMESAVIMGHTLKLNILEPRSAPLDVDALRDAVAQRLSAQPRATQRVDASGPSPRWVHADDFDIGDHVRRLPASEGLSRDDLWRSVGDLMSQHLDRTKPLWTFDVIGPLEDGAEAIAVRFHHAMVDGIAGVRFLRDLLWDIPDERAEDRAPAVVHQAPAVSRWAEARRLPGAVKRELGHRATESPLDRPVTRARELAFTLAPFAEVKAIGASRPAKATVNDVLLTIVARGLHAWLTLKDPMGRAHGEIRAQIPVSLHHRDGEAGTAEAPAGNHDSFMNVELHHDVSDPVRQLDLIRADTYRCKTLDDADELYDLFHALGRVKPVERVVRRLAGSSREFAVAISNVPGPSAPVDVAGRRVAQFFSSSEPALHHALRISAISYAGSIGIALCTDPTVLPDVSRLAEFIEAAYARLRDATVGEL